MWKWVFEAESAQRALQVEAVFCFKHNVESQLRVSPNELCNSLKAASFCGFVSFSQRFPQRFPHFLCKETFTLPDEARFIAGKVHDG